MLMHGRLYTFTVLKNKNKYPTIWSTMGDRALHRFPRSKISILFNLNATRHFVRDI